MPWQPDFCSAAATGSLAGRSGTHNRTRRSQVFEPLSVPSAPFAGLCRPWVVLGAVRAQLFSALECFAGN